MNEQEHKNDPWKSFIDENREQFNQKEPRDLWENIEGELPGSERKTIELWKVYRIAAVLLIAFGFAFFAMYNHYSEVAARKQPDVKQPLEEGYQSNDLLEVESFYTAEINDKLEEVKALTDDEVAIEEIDELRREFDELKSEMGDQINDERIVEALIKNYRLRLELLKEILEELKSSKTNYKQEGNELI